MNQALKRIKVSQSSPLIKSCLRKQWQFSVGSTVTELSLGAVATKRKMASEKKRHKG